MWPVVRLWDFKVLSPKNRTFKTGLFMLTWLWQQETLIRPSRSWSLVHTWNVWKMAETLGVQSLCWAPILQSGALWNSYCPAVLFLPNQQKRLRAKVVGTLIWVWTQHLGRITGQWWGYWSWLKVNSNWVKLINLGITKEQLWTFVSGHFSLAFECAIAYSGVCS